jgi:NADPH:quinone reductase-like Zn-dependent oxidoreductase
MPKAYGFREYGGPETQEWLDLPVPTPGPSELLVAVHAAGVNPVDWKIRAGYLPSALRLDLPAVFGNEVSGVVEHVGRDVDGFAAGDQVLGVVAPGSGGYAEYALVTASTAAKKPPHLSFTDAAALPVAGGTAYDAMQQLALPAGATLLINGVGGGVGVIAAQLARDAGITVIGTGSEAKRALAESLDATLVTYGDGVAERVRQILPDGVDAVLDLVGGDALRAVAGLAREGGRIVSTGDPQTAAEVGGSGVERNRSGEVLAALAHLVADRKIDPHVSDVRPLDHAAEALHGVEGGHSRGNVVLQVR